MEGTYYPTGLHSFFSSNIQFRRPSLRPFRVPVEMQIRSGPAVTADLVN